MRKSGTTLKYMRIFFSHVWLSIMITCSSWFMAVVFQQQSIAATMTGCATLASNGYWLLISSQRINNNDIKWVRQCFGTCEFIAIMRLYNSNTHTRIYIYYIYIYYILYCLVVTGTMEIYDFPFSWEIQKIPTDKLTHILQRGRLKPPTR